MGAAKIEDPTFNVVALAIAMADVRNPPSWSGMLTNIAAALAGIGWPFRRSPSLLDEGGVANAGACEAEHDLDLAPRG